jgi:hypothetical protein
MKGKVEQKTSTKIAKNRKHYREENPKPPYTLGIKRL